MLVCPETNQRHALANANKYDALQNRFLHSCMSYICYRVRKATEIVMSEKESLLDNGQYFYDVMQSGYMHESFCDLCISFHDDYPSKLN